MKDEEMAEEGLNKRLGTMGYLNKQNVARPYTDGFKDGFLAGLKAGRPQWHNLEKDPTDLPKDKHDVWCKYLDQYGEGWYDKDTNTWTLIYRGYHLHCIEAWCEIPTFDKE